MGAPVCFVRILFKIGLSRGPGHGAAAEQVDVNVIHGLSAVLACVQDNSVAPVETFVFCDLRCNAEQMAEQAGLVVACVRERCDMDARRDQDMDGRLRIDV